MARESKIGQKFCDVTIVEYDGVGGFLCFVVVVFRIFEGPLKLANARTISARTHIMTNEPERHQMNQIETNAESRDPLCPDQNQGNSSN